jgi:hypothetical protein
VIAGASADNVADGMVEEPIADWETTELAHLTVGRKTFWYVIVSAVEGKSCRVIQNGGFLAGMNKLAL